MAPANPVRDFGHSHVHLGELTRELAALLGDGGTIEADARQKLPALASELRHELLEHFANEEEGLFPFIRQHFPDQRNAVNRLQAAHDVICGALVRFSFLAERDGELVSDAHSAFERFESAYGNHSRDEAELLAKVAELLTSQQQADLDRLLSSLR